MCVCVCVCVCVCAYIYCIYIYTCMYFLKYVLGDMLFGRYVWSPKIYVVVWYIFSGILFLFILGKRHMEINVVKM